MLTAQLSWPSLAPVTMCKMGIFYCEDSRVQTSCRRYGMQTSGLHTIGRCRLMPVQTPRPKLHSEDQSRLKASIGPQSDARPHIMARSRPQASTRGPVGEEGPYWTSYSYQSVFRAIGGAHQQCRHVTICAQDRSVGQSCAVSPRSSARVVSMPVYGHDGCRVHQ